MSLYAVIEFVPRPGRYIADLQPEDIRSATFHADLDDALDTSNTANEDARRGNRPERYTVSERFEMRAAEGRPVVVHEFSSEALARHQRLIRASALRDFVKELDAEAAALELGDDRPGGLEYAAALAERRAYRIEHGAHATHDTDHPHDTETDHDG